MTNTETNPETNPRAKRPYDSTGEAQGSDSMASRLANGMRQQLNSIGQGASNMAETALNLLSNGNPASNSQRADAATDSSCVKHLGMEPLPPPAELPSAERSATTNEAHISGSSDENFLSTTSSTNHPEEDPSWPWQTVGSSTHSNSQENRTDTTASPVFPYVPYTWQVFPANSSTSIVSNGPSSPPSPFSPPLRTVTPADSVDELQFDGLPDRPDSSRINTMAPPPGFSRAPARATPPEPRTLYDHEAIENAYRTNARTDAPWEGPEGHQFNDYMVILKHQRAKQIANYKLTDNFILLQLDWDTVGTKFNLASMYGDWVHGAKVNNLARRPQLLPCQLIRNFIEVQIKRIDGDDDKTLEACGVDPKYAFMGLLGEPNKEPDTKGKGKLTDPDGYSPESGTSFHSASTVADMMAATAGGWPRETLNSSHTVGESSSKPSQTVSKPSIKPVSQSTPVDPALTGNEPGSQTGNQTGNQTKASKIPTVWTPNEKSGSGTSAAGGTTQKTGLWRPPTPAPKAPRVIRSFADTHSSDSSSSSGSDSSPVKAPQKTPESNEEARRKMHEALYNAFDERYHVACKRFDHMISESCTFDEMKKSASVYLVRIIGLEGPPDWASIETNHFNGPRERFGTLLGMGGWIVQDKTKLKKAEEKIKGTPAKDAKEDWTFEVLTLVGGGEFLPTWKGEGEPTLEDVYHMVWDVMMGRRFVGLVPGFGFGVRADKNGFPLSLLRLDNPFQTTE